MRLDGIGQYQSVDPNGLLGLIAKEKIQIITPAEAVQLANRFGAGRVIMGTVIRAGTEIQLNASLYSDPELPEIEVTALALQEEAISGSIDQLA